MFFLWGKFGNFFIFEENTFFYCFLNLQVVIYLWSLWIIFSPCLTFIFPIGVLTLGIISPLEKIHFSLFLESPGHDLSIILEDHLVVQVGVFTLETISPLEKIHFSLILEYPGHDLSLTLEGHFLSLFNSWRKYIFHCFLNLQILIYGMNLENYWPLWFCL